MKGLFLSVLLCFLLFEINAQTNNANPITTAVPSLTVTPDARSGAMGDVGVALTADANSLFWNPSQIAFMENGTKVSASYSPWLRNMDTDMHIAYVSFIDKIDSRTAMGASLRYFNLGSVDLYDDQINPLGTYNPTEFSFDGSIARSYGNNLSFGLSLRYTHSDLGNVDTESKLIDVLSADASMTFRKNIQQFGKDSRFSFGVNISNIGPKVDYSNVESNYFLPTNLRVGAANTWLLNAKSELTFALDLNKLLVPTPPTRGTNGQITNGKDDDRSAVSGIFGSFNDAPGGASEEFKEISYSSGVEYLYDKQLALRAGYFYENPDKGTRRYATFGAGFRYQTFDFNFSYLAGRQDKSPLANSLRFSIAIDFK